MPGKSELKRESFVLVRGVEPDRWSSGSTLAKGHSAHYRTIKTNAYRKKRIAFIMTSQHTIDKSARAGRASQIAALVITGLVAFSFVYFGSLYLIHDPDEWGIANQQLGYPLYIIPLIGVTQILGGAGLLIPNVPRLTEWVYAGLAFTVLLALYSQLSGSGSIWNKCDPILVLALVCASYVLRRRMGTNRWSI